MALLENIPAEILVESSLSGRGWSLRGVDERACAALAREPDLHPLRARLLLARGIAVEDCHDFLNPSLRNSLPDPSSFLDMDVAAERLAAAVIGGETIGIFGDYDVDGATSSALLHRFFRALGVKIVVHIPDRIAEGYGPNTPALMKMKEQGASVIITVDCGTLSFEPLKAARAAGLDVIVADHHIGSAEKPDAYAIVNPNRLDESSPHGQLAAVGVCFLLAVATNRTLRDQGFYKTHPEPDLLSLLDLVALGTVCDVVPLTGANRALVAQGLKVMLQRHNLGLRTLLDVARVDEPPATYHAGFILGPRINAGGRVGHAPYGTRLLSTEDPEEAQTLAKALDSYNEERKEIEATVLREAFAQAEKMEDTPLLCLCGEGWHPGVIGIVAGRVKERFGKPTAVISFEAGIGKASARSIPGFDFGAAVIAAKDSDLLVAGGGHAMAAGFTVEKSLMPSLEQFLTRRFSQQLPGGVPAGISKVDACVALSGATHELAELLEQAAPFGQGNPQPRLMIQHAKVAKVTPVGTDHLRLILTDDDGTRLTAMAFRCLSTPLGQKLLQLSGKRIHALGQLRLRMWQGQQQCNFTLEDAALV